MSLSQKIGMAHLNFQKKGRSIMKSKLVLETVVVVGVSLHLLFQAYNGTMFSWWHAIILMIDMMLIGIVTSNWAFLLRQNKRKEELVYRPLIQLPGHKSRRAIRTPLLTPFEKVIRQFDGRVKTN